jgi:chromate reductase
VTSPAAPARFRVVAYSGSVRAASSNTGLVRLAQRVAPDNLLFEYLDWVDQLPYYNADLESDLPEPVQRLRRLVTDADAIVIGMPEYNWGPSALAKNVIDWLTRPLGQHALRGKVVVMLTSAGKGGGATVQGAITPILEALGNQVLAEPAVLIALGANRISPDGVTEDSQIIDLVTHKMVNLERALADRQESPAAS